MFHGWMFDPDGDQAAADSTRSSTSLDTGSSVNPRTARRLVTASYTSIIAYLTPAIAMSVTKHSGTNATSCVKTTSPVSIAYPTCTPLNIGAAGRKRVIGESHLARP